MPEPITVPGSVADGDYATRVRFARFVGVCHLISLAALAGMVAIFMRPESRLYVDKIGFEAVLLFSASCLVVLAAVRHASVVWQTLFLIGFLISSAAWMGSALARGHEIYPGFMETLGIGIATAWTSVLLYNLLCGRDYSFVGEFTLSLLAVFVFATLYAVRVKMALLEIAVVLGLCAIAVGYWTYDLAMILGRRTAAEKLQAVFDLYRDMLNFLWFPVRILRMPRRRRRSIS